MNIPVIFSDDVTVTTNTLRDLSADVGVLAAFGQIVPQTLIDLFPLGIVNLHPSRLPAYRGPTPIEQAILDGLESTAVSIMQLGAGMDSGPVFAQQDVVVPTLVSKQALSELLHKEGSQLLFEVLPDILNGSLKPVEQDHDKKTTCKLLTKQSGVIDWSRDAEDIEKAVRAFTGWPKSKTTFDGVDVIITAAHTSPVTHPEKPGFIEVIEDTGTLLVYCGVGGLCIDTLVPAGKKEMSVGAFLNGYRKRLLGKS